MVEGPPTCVHGQLRQVAEVTACNSSKALLNLVVNGSDAMTDVEAVRRRLFVRTERTREEDTSARPCQREPTWTSRSIKKRSTLPCY